MGFLSGLFGPRVQVITSPRAGVLNLLGASVADLAERDAQFLEPLFGNIATETTHPPQCNALFVYCSIAPDGTVQGSRSSLREIVRDSGAVVVVFASPNPGDAYVKAGKPAPYGKANLVITLNRKGDAFGRFFKALFTDMKHGVSMPKAWVKLAPQIPGRQQADILDCIFACEAGQLAFG